MSTDVTMRDLDLVIQHTSRALLALRAETAEQSLAEAFVKRFASLDAEGVDAFFDFLLAELGPDRALIDAAIVDYQTSGTPLEIANLADALESPRLTLFRRVNHTPKGISCLLDIRTELRARRRSRPELRPVERDLTHILTSWFNRGFLELRQLDWTTPAHILEKLIQYEAVHEIQGWTDLQRRLAPDRRAFGFFHPALPDEPIIFVQVALTQGMADSIQRLLSAEPDASTEPADSAIFYSITNCQSGLAGISFGNFLIKRVSLTLKAEFPDIETFATLSPIPGFAAWLDEQDNTTSIDAGVDRSNQQAMEAACARYLLGARRGDLPLDPVARFHLRNGARVERLNWRGDTSEKGMRESHALLVNYLYSGQDVEANHDALVLDGVVMASPSIVEAAGLADVPDMVATAPDDLVG